MKKFKVLFEHTETLVCLATSYEKIINVISIEN